MWRPDHASCRSQPRRNRFCQRQHGCGGMILVVRRPAPTQGHRASRAGRKRSEALAFFVQSLPLTRREAAAASSVVCRREGPRTRPRGIQSDALRNRATECGQIDAIRQRRAAVRSPGRCRRDVIARRSSLPGRFPRASRNDWYVSSRGHMSGFHRREAELVANRSYNLAIGQHVPVRLTVRGPLRDE